MNSKAKGLIVLAVLGAAFAVAHGNGKNAVQLLGARNTPSGTEVTWYSPTTNAEVLVRSNDPAGAGETALYTNAPAAQSTNTYTDGSAPTATAVYGVKTLQF